ncbi:alpha/beta hydrolase [Actinomadura spongiicola]|uniref:Alpha/beta hydrolase n=1 Tax=Actinomadura spongiicola TaxID=2303421 RepID=A0A372GPY6_9ACTN|nr:alpha/beta hydrolase [Actinomadura spongiicola]RFS87385.1 alpha/beta hydrolase [Actinomadura spongiicola]
MRDPSTRPWFARLDDDARVQARRLTEIVPRPLHRLGVEASRRLTFPVLPRGPELFDVRNVEIEVAGGTIGARIYRPGEGRGHPLLLYFHGGGFFLGSVDGVDALCRHLAFRSGRVVVSVGYRLAPEHPFPVPADDCLAATLWAAERAERWGADPARIALGGDSAGATLAISTAIGLHRLGGPAPGGLLLAYPAVDVTFSTPSWTEFADAPLITTEDARWTWGMYLGRHGWDDPRAVPNRAADLSFLPPTLVVTAEVDVLRDDAAAFADRLASEGVTARHREYPGVFHGFFTEVGLYRRTTLAVDESAVFLRRLPRMS